jgi:hypothetical protein
MKSSTAVFLILWACSGGGNGEPLGARGGENSWAPATAAAAASPPHPHRRGKGAMRGRGSTHDGRCVGAVGQWCGGFYSQPLVPFRRPPPRGAPCPNACGGVGVCHGDTGRCDCPAGAGGPACGDHLKRPCTKNFRSPRNSSVPNSHIGDDKRDLDWHAPESTYSR